jgi:uncharacterized membrane protein YadS
VEEGKDEAWGDGSRTGGSGCLGLGAWGLGTWTGWGWGVSSLTLAILGGMLLGNTVYTRWEDRCGPGVQFAQKTLLRWGVVLFGFRLTLGDVATVGWRVR